ncbi:MAG TPA: AI-2E family transporter [Acetivibrio sp.]|uniref:AI-2E family transporter n=1 Tax=Acetivibrio sp. TaxID=1872092 RepID=UPI002CDF7BB4|nr:AI-2E family transporter [Acetivibrio sp.]HOM02941.1 AI-2E family transporter [Acetivibrio sp.]
MSDKMTRNLIIVITYAVALVLIVINFTPIMQAVWKFIVLFKPFFIGIAIAFVLNKPCMAVEKFLNKRLFKNRLKSVARGLAITITYLLVFLMITLIISFIIPELIKSIQVFLNNMGAYIDNFCDLTNEVSELLGLEKIDLSSLDKLILEYTNKLGSSITELMPKIISITTGVVSFIATLVITVVFSIYILAGKERLMGQCKKVFGTYLPKGLYNKGAYVYRVVVDVFNKYIYGQLAEAFILGSLCFIGMIILRFEYALLISVLIAITALVPYFGAYIGGFCAFMLLLMISPTKAIWFLVYLIVLQQLENNLIYPRVAGSSLGLPGIWVVLAVIVGAGVGGSVGVLLGVPIATVIFTLVKNDVLRRAQKQNINSK